MDVPTLHMRGLILGRALSEEGDIFPVDTSFSAVTLHDRSVHSWAVIGDASGAIASRSDGSLFMRMREEDAHVAASQLTEAGSRTSTRH